METEITKWFATLGVGGAIGGIIFWFYRMDRLRCEKNHEVMLQLIERTAIANEKMAQRLEQVLTRVIK